MGWKRNLAVGAGVLFGLTLLAAALGGPAKDAPVAGQSAASEAAAPPAPPANNPGISAAEFAALKPGMTSAEVTAIVGSEGELISENQLAGIRTIMVKWDGESGFGANANAMFQNGKLIQKSQFGLE